MRTKLMVLVTLTILGIASVPSRAQKPEEGEKSGTRVAPLQSHVEQQRVIKVIRLKYVDADAVRRMLDAYGIVSKVSDERIKNVLTISGSAFDVATVEEVIKTLDVPEPPAKNIEVTGYLLVASQKPGEGANLPSELQPVVSQLQKLMNYRDFRLMTTLLVRTREREEGRLNGVAAMEGKETAGIAEYVFWFRTGGISPGEDRRTIRIDQLQLNLQFPKGSSGHPDDKDAKPPGASISASLDLQEGQKAVVGKTTFDSPQNALILVLTAKVVD